MATTPPLTSVSPTPSPIPPSPVTPWTSELRASLPVWATYIAVIWGIAIVSIRFMLPLIYELPFALHIRPERIAWGGIVYTPETLLAKFEEKTSDVVLTDDTLHLLAPDFIYHLPIRGNVPALKHLATENVPLDRLPEDIGDQTGLESLYITNARLTSLPQSIGSLQHLTYLRISGTRLSKVPESIGNLQSINMLDLSYNNLSELPASISNIPYVYILNLTGNKFRSVPANLPQKVEYIFLGDNPIPASIIHTVGLPNVNDIFF